MNLRLGKPTSSGAKAIASAVLVSIAALAVTITSVPGAYGAFTAKVTNDKDTAATAVGCTAWAQGSPVGSAFFAYPLGESSAATGAGVGVTLATAADVSGNNNTGSYSLAGVTGGQTNGVACAKDKTTAVLLDGKTGAIYGPATQTDPVNFTEEIWFKTAKGYGSGGKLIGVGNLQTGPSGNYDRHLYMTNNGNVVFGVYPGSVQTIISPNAYNDGNWHFAVATMCNPKTYTAGCPLSSATTTATGMSLYIDGALVATNTGITTTQDFAGYWRIGYDSMANWGSTTPTSNFFAGYLAWAQVYNTSVLSYAQIAAQYTAGS